MAIALKLNMRQSQSLVMTPQLSQSIKLLAMSNIELSAFVESEIERNPLLERDIRPDGQAEDFRQTTPDSDAAAQSGQSDEVRDVTQYGDLETSGQALSENLGSSIENIYPDEQDYVKADAKPELSRDGPETHITSSGLPVSSGPSAHDRTVADFAPTNLTLRDHLLSQLSMANVSPTVALLTSGLIDCLDEAGYLHLEGDDIAERLNANQAEMDVAIALLQSFEPCGTGARSLSECLALQLKERNRLDPAMQGLLDNLELFAKRDFAQLKQITGLSQSDLQEALLEIRALDPKPGTAFESASVQHIIADVFVKEASDGSWNVELNSETLPRVLVNETYAATISTKIRAEADQEFLGSCLQTANWLTRSLDQRAQTILKVASEIVRRQDGFLVHGVRHLKPLTLQEVAEAIDMHESSVSRVTNDKYMMTPRGIFELKYFFTTAIADAHGGESHSAAAVRDHIRGLIEAESSDKILSDDAIVDLLKSQGFELARRTVAKYREAMNIPSSVQRRREKRMMTNN